MRRSPRVVAIIATFNEADIVLSCVKALTEQGVESYVLDDGSSDGTPDLLRPLVGHGVIAVERMDPSETFDLSKILRRKEALSFELDADWFINHDADEFRESPWPTVTLTEAIGEVESAGYNAIDFALLDFWPISGSPGLSSSAESVVTRFTRFEYGLPFNTRQIRCWRRQGVAVDLASSGGHDVAFAGRRVFPLRFLLRHYPIRSDEHGRRKVWQERMPRFTADERARGWHVQYDALQSQVSTFARDPSTLIEFEPMRARLTVALEDIGRIQAALDTALQNSTALHCLAASTQAERDALAARIEDTLEPALAAAAGNIRQLEMALTTSRDELARAHARQLEAEAAWQQRHNAARQELNALRDAHARLEANANKIWLELQRVYASRTWRWTRAGRVLARLLGL